MEREKEIIKLHEHHQTIMKIIFPVVIISTLILIGIAIFR